MASQPDPGQPVVLKPGPEQPRRLTEARRGFVSKLRESSGSRLPIEPPPPEAFLEVVQYESPAGKLAAYMTPDTGVVKRPAMMWIGGGDCNTIGPGCWTVGPPENEQSASAYRMIGEGMVMMYPSLRGGNTNPGSKEGFLGEVDDVIRASGFLARQPHVDSTRIYLGGHSTGGTLALLVSECTDRFRAVFSFGPADDVSGYHDRFLPFDKTQPREVELRSPIHWLGAITSPTFVIEGNEGRGNIDLLRNMARANTNPHVHFIEVDNANHFTLLSWSNIVIASRIGKDIGPRCNITLTPADLKMPPSRGK
jgi:dipeptidyl aminopeptidase/acylaminoacyl peptidase